MKIQRTPRVPEPALKDALPLGTVISVREQPDQKYKQDYAAIIRPENYCKLLPQCFVCSGKDDFLKAQTKQFVKLLNADGRHFQYVFSDAKGADHAYAALHPETEWGEMANDDMLAFFDRCKR